jgi:hypothetical protein
VPDYLNYCKNIKKYSWNIHKLLQLFDSTIMNLHETRTKGRGIFYKPITCCNIFTIVQIIRHFFIFLFFSNSLIKDVLFSFNILTAETIKLPFANNLRNCTTARFYMEIHKNESFWCALQSHNLVQKTAQLIQ